MIVGSFYVSGDDLGLDMHLIEASNGARAGGAKTYGLGSAPWSFTFVESLNRTFLITSSSIGSDLYNNLEDYGWPRTAEDLRWSWDNPSYIVEPSYICLLYTSPSPRDS